MNDERPPEPDEPQPEPSTDETDEPDEPGIGDASTPSYRVAPFRGIDMGNILRIQAMARQVTAQLAGINSLHRDVLRNMDQRWRIQPPVIPQVTTWAASLTAVQRGLAEQMRQAARIQASLPQYDFGPDLGRIVAASRQPWLANIRTLVDRLQRVIPENLRDLSSEDLEKVFQVNIEDGTSLAWAPRSSVVQELLQAADMDARGAVLVAHATEIADDVEASLTQVAQPEHDALRSLLLEAASALRAGLYGPAQAAACNAFDTIVNVRTLNFLAYSGRRSKDQTRKHFRPTEDWDDVTFAELELVLVGGGIATAFEYWNAGSGPASFNRNGSVHHVDDGAYTPAHAVRSLLIAQATLRWLDTAIAEDADDEDAA